MANDRDCENCKHYKEVLCKGGIFYHSCESWDCEFEPKEDEPFEPCEDCISRQEMLEGLANIAKAKARSDAQKALMGRIMFFTEQLPSVNPQKPCKDAISRQAVLDLLVKYDNDMKFDVYSEIFDNINKLPPVNPQKPICPSAGVDCEDCPAYEKKPNINEVLDKIRAEIMDCLKALDEIEKSGLNIYLPNEISGRRLTYQQCLEFIDKYKAEGSEE